MRIDNQNKTKISVIGLGKLGCPMLAVFASKGFEVIGVDINQEFVDLINKGLAPVKEPKLQDMLLSNKERISATTNIKQAVIETDICFIIVPTPSGKDYFFKNEYVINAINAIGNALKDKSGYFNVIVTSTVMPGSTGGEIKEALEHSSGRKVGKNLGLCYNPEFIALGTVVRDMLYPDMLLIGESDNKAGDLLEEIYRNSVESNPSYHRMNWINAELCKIAVNTFVTTKISYANMIADICDRLEGANSDIVTNAVGSDSRIGNKYLKGGIGYGGPCFPRDNKAFAALGDSLGARTDLAKATDSINDYQTTRLLDLIKNTIPRESTISILGISYKPNTPVIEESQGLALAKELILLKYTVKLTDPQSIYEIANQEFFDKNISADLDQTVKNADAIIIMTPWKEYLNMDFSKLNCKYIIDPWRVLNKNVFSEKINLIQPGVGKWFFDIKNTQGVN